ncbi:hydroxypyruvate isomerase family protein [Vallitalea okinawensis]|uniref:hydroxypyruvate isomerase family protein n=1 Tax=Vallitalea okinawensis TaxID=2078660 RepID=UPI000CFD3B37|nr:TIM barrel protein [Vallitalea okinawensis]
MKKSACIEMIFTEVDFYNRFKLAKEAGFTNIEFWSWDDKDLDRIKALCEEYGLTVASFSGDKDFSLVDMSHQSAYIDYVNQSIQAAQKLDCKNLVIHSNSLGEGGIVVNHYEEKSNYEKFGAMVSTLTKLATIAEEAGITLVLEALNTEEDHVGNFLAYTRDAVTAIKCVASPNIKILYDIYHMQLMEGKVINIIHENVEHIGYIHVADAPGRLEPGTGEINYTNVFKALSDVNYDGYIGFELMPSHDSMDVAKGLIALF